MKNNRVDASALQNALQQLPESSNTYLSHIQASESLKQSIIQNAYLKPHKARTFNFINRRGLFRYLVTFSAIALFLFSTILFSSDDKKDKKENRNTMFRSIPASGGNETLQTSTTQGEFVSSGLAVIENSDVQYAELWVRDKKSFPFVKVNDTLYRLLDLDVQDKSLLSSESIGSIQEQSQAAEKAENFSSNILAKGTLLFNIADMEDYLIAAEKNGDLLFFQKYSTDKGSIPFFTSTLIPKLKSIYVHSLGEISDPSKAKEAMLEINKLAIPSDTAPTQVDYLILSFDNGLKLQYAIDSNLLQANGSYSIEKFYDVLQKYLP